MDLGLSYWVKSERERQIHIALLARGIFKKGYKLTYLQNRVTNLENKPVVIMGKGRVKGWIGNLGLTYTYYYI